MSKQTHTLGPWELERNATHAGQIATVHWCGETDDENYWMEIWSPEAFNASPMERLANAEFIVKACNSHDALVAALQQFVNHDGVYYGTVTQNQINVIRAALTAAGAA